MTAIAPNVARREYRTAAAASRECWVTQVVRWAGPPAVVRVKTATEVVVALPYALPPDEALDLARLVLDGREYAELNRKIKPTRPRRESRASSPRQARRCR